MKKHITIFTILIFIGCERKEDEAFDSFSKFPEKINLIHEEIKTPPVLVSIAETILLDDFFVAMDMKSDTFFYFFSYPSFEYLGGFITKGKGPGEELFINPFIRHIDENTFLYQTMNSINISEFDINTANINIIEKVDLPIELMNLQHLFRLNGFYYGWDITKTTEREFIGYDPVKDDIFEFGPSHPSFEEEIPANMKNRVFEKVLVVKPDKSLFAAAYGKFPILRIYYSEDGRLKNEVRFENNQKFPYALIKDDLPETAREKVMQNYWKIDATETYIYALYSGKTHGETSREFQFSPDDISNELHVWDWEGNPVMKILLDRKIFSFVISPDDDYLICSSLTSMDKLYKYEIQ